MIDFLCSFHFCSFLFCLPQGYPDPLLTCLFGALIVCCRHMFLLLFHISSSSFMSVWRLHHHLPTILYLTAYVYPPPSAIRTRHRLISRSPSSSSPSLSKYPQRSLAWPLVPTIHVLPPAFFLFLRHCLRNQNRFQIAHLPSFHSSIHIILPSSIG